MTQAAQKEIGIWELEYLFKSDIEVSKEEVETFIDDHKAIIDEYLQEKWELFNKTKKERLSKERAAYLDAVVGMCNTPFSTYWEQHFA